MSAQSQYRRDVDGLRAVAILPVLLFHAGFSGFSGGYVGVDVFFVISGFLITGVLVREVRAGEFSLSRFYVRRARRILPALLTVLTVTLGLGLWVLGPSELRDLAKTTAAAALSASNVVLWRSVGYFDGAAELKPMLMTWSLAVEEQFYLLWPLALYACHRARRSPGALVAAVAALSFGASWWQVTHAPSAAYYLLPSRAWELLIGAGLAIGARPAASRGALRDAASIAGLGLVLASIVAFDADTRFPGAAALLPCGGTALLLWAGEDAFVNRSLLSSRPFVHVGLISYSLYLWHWPLLSLGRILNLGALPVAWAVGAVLGSFACAYATWRFVEKPFRRPGSLGDGPTLWRYGGATIAVAAAAGAVFFARGLPGRVRPDVVRADAAREDGNPRQASCADQAGSPHLPSARCVSGARDAARVLALWGDSHGDALAPGAQTWAEARGRGFVQITQTGCPPLPGVRVLRGDRVSDGCTAFNARALAAIEHDPRIDVVVLVARWALYAETTRVGNELGPEVFLVDEATDARSRDDSRRVFSMALRRVTSALTSAGKTVVVVGQVPEAQVNIPDCVTRAAIGIGATPRCAVSAADVSERLLFTNRVIEEIARSDPRVRAVDPSRVLCAGGTCEVLDAGVPLYRDNNHLTRAGAIFLTTRLDLP